MVDIDIGKEGKDRSRGKIKEVSIKIRDTLVPRSEKGRRKGRTLSQGRNKGSSGILEKRKDKVGCSK